MVLLYYVALFIIFSESGQESSELESIVSVFNVFKQKMFGVFLENMKREVNNKKVGYFLLKANPHFPLHVGKSHQLLLIQHCD
jgi:hypothetical protein